MLRSKIPSQQASAVGQRLTGSLNGFKLLRTLILTVYEIKRDGHCQKYRFLAVLTVKGPKLMLQTQFGIVKLLCAEIKHSDWFKLLM